MFNLNSKRMNKKFLFGMFAAAGMLLATSCSNDELIEQVSGDTATVSFTINTEGAVASRAADISDGSNATVLQYQVYHVERGDYEVFYHPHGDLVVDKDFHGSKTIQIPLGKGQEYAIGFWAESPAANENNYYEISLYDQSGMSVSIDYSQINNNDENSDAFFGNVNFTVSGNESKTVILKRPFAQINVGASDYSDFLGGSNNDIVNSSVVIKNAATTLNLLNGEVSGETTVTFGADHGAIYLDKNQTDCFEPIQTLTVNGTKYTWLSMCYVLPQDKDQSTTVSAEFNFEVTAGNNFTLKDGLQNIPIQRNFRTNIIGNLLTNNVDFKVEIDANFEKPDHNINSMEQLELASKNGGTVTLFQDLEINKPIDVQKDMTLNLNGYTLTYNVPASEGSAFLFTVKDATLVLDGGEIVVNDPTGVHKKSGCGVYMNALKGGKIIVNGGSYTVNDCTVIQADGGEVEINGGTFNISDDSWGYKYMLNTVDNSGGKIVVKGGKFHNFDPANNEADGNGTKYVPEGYKSTHNGEWYNVASEVEIAAAQGGSVTLTTDLVLNGPVNVEKDMTLNLNGYTLTYNTPKATGPQHLFTVGNGVTLTLDGGDIVVKDGNRVRFTKNGGCYVGNALAGGKIVVNGGSYNAQDCTVFQADGGTVEINGGSFDISETKWGYVYMLNLKERAGRENNGSIVVKGGKFHNYNPAVNGGDHNGKPYLATGYKSVKDGDWYHVSKNN